MMRRRISNRSHPPRTEAGPEAYAVDIYLFHSLRYAFPPDILQVMSGLPVAGLVRIVDEPVKARSCFDNDYTDVAQLPLSIFDHRMKAAGICVHRTRSGTALQVSRLAWLVSFDKCGQCHGAEQSLHGAHPTFLPVWPGNSLPSSTIMQM